MKRLTIILASVAVTVAIAHGQPLPDVPITPEGSGSAGSDQGSAQAPPNNGQPIGPIPPDEDPPIGPTDPYPPQPPPKPKKPLPPIYMPEVLTTPTGWLLPAAVLYSKTSLDTGGGVTSDTRIGLGDVAEFGVATTDAVRDRVDESVRASRIQPYITASFRLGVQEDRLFKNQPGLTLGFRKSFERNHDDFTTRFAELTLVASKHFGKNVAFHVGGAFWDASLRGDLDGDANTEASETTLHDISGNSEGGILKHQVRVFGGIEVRPLPRSQILIDLGWSPEFCYRCTNSPTEMGDDLNANKIRLKPVLSWGVRYEVARWMRLESGVRLPDIGEANLLEAQIFGQVTFTSWALRRAVDSLK
jgi:hypothetical protein